MSKVFVLSVVLFCVMSRAAYALPVTMSATLWSAMDDGTAYTASGSGAWAPSDTPQRLFLASGGMNGPFIAPPALTDGVYTFGFWGDGNAANAPTYLPGNGQTHYGISVALNAGTGQARFLSVIAPANSVCTATGCELAAYHVQGSFGITALPATYSVITAGTAVSILGFSIFTEANGLDRVSALTTGANGAADYYGEFTIQVGNVVAVPAPATPWIFWTGSMLLFALRRRRGI